MTQDEQINFLNRAVKTKLGVSKIHGIGVFAIRDIEKGSKLFATMAPQVFKIPYGSINKLFPEIKEQLLERWPNIVNNQYFAWPDTKIDAFMNHAPTQEDINYDPELDITTQDIPKGAEILEDYTIIPNYDKVFPWLAKKKKEEEKK